VSGSHQILVANAVQIGSVQCCHFSACCQQGVHLLTFDLHFFNSVGYTAFSGTMVWAERGGNLCSVILGMGETGENLELRQSVYVTCASRYEPGMFVVLTTEPQSSVSINCLCWHDSVNMSFAVRKWHLSTEGGRRVVLRTSQPACPPVVRVACFDVNV
jgi:hypothetical protein